VIAKNGLANPVYSANGWGGPLCWVNPAPFAEPHFYIQNHAEFMVYANGVLKCMDTIDSLLSKCVGRGTTDC
jgi:hypothetical protein